MKNLKVIFFGAQKYAQIYKNSLENYGYEFFEITNFKKAEDIMKKINPDLGIIACFGKILPENILKIPKYGFLNIHPSLLPKWRGSSPVRSAISAGDTKTGVTIHITTPEIDAGPVLFQAEMPINPKDNYLLLEERLFNEGAKVLPKVMEMWANGQIAPRSQNESMATYSKKVKTEDGLIDWSRTASEILRQIRAYSPEPGVYINVGGARLKIKQAEKTKNQNLLENGRFFEADGFPAVVCKNSALKLLVVQPEGKKDMSGDAYLRGHRKLTDFLVFI